MAAFATKATSEKAGEFLAANKDLFNLNKVTIMAADRREGTATESLRYRQEHEALPVWGAELVVGIEKNGKVASAVNKLDYEISADLTRDKVRLTAAEAAAATRKALGALANSVVTGTATLYVYRRAAAPPVAPPRSLSVGHVGISRLGKGQVGRAYLAWLVPADTEQPHGNWDVFVDAQSGELVNVIDRRRYAGVKAMVFRPDPITTSMNATLSSATPEGTLNPFRFEVDLENLEPPAGGVLKLDGKWAASRELENPTFPPPTSTTDFKYAPRTGNS
jgi:Zn-dependent metalloprotease